MASGMLLPKTISAKVPFNEADPINTPRELKITVQTRQALGDAIAYFQNEGIALDASLGELQYVLGRVIN